jgi:ferrous iron transport protein B
VNIQWQSLLVGLLVAACFVYAAWTLMPQMARRALATGLLRLPIPSSVSAYFARVAQTSSGCNCSGCERASVKQGLINRRDATAPQPLVFHPRQR